MVERFLSSTVPLVVTKPQTLMEPGVFMPEIFQML